MKAALDSVGIEPDFMAARFQIGLDAPNQRNVDVVRVAEKDFHAAEVITLVLK